MKLTMFSTLECGVMSKVIDAVMSFAIMSALYLMIVTMSIMMIIYNCNIATKTSSKGRRRGGGGRRRRKLLHIILTVK